LQSNYKGVTSIVTL